jgi:hypothetical protein
MITALREQWGPLRQEWVTGGHRAATETSHEKELGSSNEEQDIGDVGVERSEAKRVGWRPQPLREVVWVRAKAE